MDLNVPYGRQEISAEDVQAVVDVLHSDFLTQGPAVPKFEERIARYCQASYGIAVNSATSALHIACLALEVGTGDVVWTSPITFVASANCALYCGAKVDFVDIDPLTYNLSADRLEDKLRLAARSNSLPKLVVAVHLCGQPCDMAAIHELAQKYGFKVIEDASHAIGGRYRQEVIGCCRYSDITIFSFHPVKIITTGEGGMAVTNNEAFAKRMRLLRSHGVTRDETQMEKVPDGAWYYEQIDLGFNYRMTDMQAALGLSQMGRVDEFVAKRHEIAKRYGMLLPSAKVTLPYQADYGYSGMHLYVVRLHLSQMQRSHRQVFESMRAQGIGVNLHYMPVYRQPYYYRLGFPERYCPEADRYYEEAISLPMFPGLTEQLQDRVVAALNLAISECG